MKVLVYSARPYDRQALDAANSGRHELVYTESQLDDVTLKLAEGYDAVCLFVNDHATAGVLAKLAVGGTRLIVQRSTGYNNIDLAAAAGQALTVMRVGYYSPYAVAEHAVGLLLAVNRKVHRAYSRTRDNNFLLDGLVGADIHGKTVGIVGTGKIGSVFASILRGFGTHLLAYDLAHNPAVLELGVHYVDISELARQADVIALFLPLTPQTHHIIGYEALRLMKPGVILINTSRGGLIDSEALIEGLKAGRIGGVGLDVYEAEEGLFFRDFSQQIVQDDVYARLVSFPNVLVTGHQAFLTWEALEQIAVTTIRNLDDFAAGRSNENTLTHAAVS